MENTGRLIIDIQGLSLESEDKYILQEKGIAGIIFFSRNYESIAQIKELVAEIRSIRPDILITVDQEGGRVQRFKGEIANLPSIYKVATAAEKQPDILQAAAIAMAYPIIELGIDLSFAPVLDLYNEKSTVIGDRAFADSPEQVVLQASTYIEAMASCGMANVVKHFPGHGCVAEDSHLELPTIDLTMAEIEQHIQPFKQLSNKAKGVMVAHLLLPKIASEITTYSKHWITNILKQQYNFKGAVFCDDLSMAAASDLSPEIKVESSINSGCDLLLYCNARDAVKRVLGSKVDTVCSSSEHQQKIQGLYKTPNKVSHSDYTSALKLIETLL